MDAGDTTPGQDAQARLNRDDVPRESARFFRNVDRRNTTHLDTTREWPEGEEWRSLRAGDLILRGLYDELYDNSVGKTRTCLVLEVDESDCHAEVLVGTSFGGQEPPEDKRDGCLVLLNVDNTEGKVDAVARSLPFIKFYGNQLRKTVYMRFDRPKWLKVEMVPFAQCGGLKKEDYGKLGKICGLRANHSFWQRGREVEAQAGEAGGDREQSESQRSED